MWPQEAELIFGPYTSFSFETKEDMGTKRLIKLRVSISTNRPDLEGLDLDDCTAIPPWAATNTVETADDHIHEQAEMAAMQEQLHQIKLQKVKEAEDRARQQQQQQQPPMPAQVTSGIQLLLIFTHPPISHTHLEAHLYELYASPLDLPPG
jgi:hypothetical protein